jgi:hypothetical protein
VFAGTNSYATSASAAQNITVKGVLTVDTIAASGTPGKYALTATVRGSGTLPLTGNVSFFDASNAKLPLGTVTLGKNIATSGFSALAFSSNGSEPIALAAGDFNNDGTPDLTIANLNSSTVEIFSVRGGFSNPVTVHGQTPMALAVGDFKNDGKLDVVIADFNSSQVEVHFGNGTSRSPAASSCQPASGLTALLSETSTTMATLIWQSPTNSIPLSAFFWEMARETSLPLTLPATLFLPLVAFRTPWLWETSTMTASKT